jgi:hypothetical protein
MALSINAAGTNDFPRISEKAETGYFPLSQSAIYLDAEDYKVVGITAVKYSAHRRKLIRS